MKVKGSACGTGGSITNPKSTKKPRGRSLEREKFYNTFRQTFTQNEARRTTDRPLLRAALLAKQFASKGHESCGRPSLSTHVGTRKMVNYAWAGRSQGKLWWRLVAILTCKSFVWFGY